MPTDQVQAAQAPQPSGLAEIRAHLTAALELLDKMGGSDVVPQQVNPKIATYMNQQGRGPGE
jgi:hypothetical protein